MSHELTGREVNEAFSALDAAHEATSTAQEQGVKLRDYIDWLEEQVADRDDEIQRLTAELAEAREA